MAIRTMRCLKFLFFTVVLICGLHKVCSQIAFERKLDSAAINFDDFPPDYSQALMVAHRESKTLDYTWPSRANNTIPPAAAQTTIPPIIHFIWFQDLYTEHLDVSQIPTSGSHAPSFCQQHNPSFKVYIWNTTTARAFLEDHYAWFLPRYDNYPYPIQRIDAFKYFVLWHYGGIYMDLDISCRRPLDPLLGYAAWYPKASPFGVNNDLMGSRARHPLLGEMLQELSVRDKSWVFPYLTVFWSTGPQFVSDVLWGWGQRNKGAISAASGRKQSFERDGVRILPPQFYSEEYTFFGHSPGGTWHGKDVAVVLWFVDRPWIFVLVPTLVFVVFVSVLRRRQTWRRLRRLGSFYHSSPHQTRADN